MHIIQFSFLHKTASMFAHQIMSDLSKEYDLEYFSPNNTPSNHLKIVERVKLGGDATLLFGPSRDYNLHSGLINILSGEGCVFNVCQVRNPLDIIVSQYFSHGWTHPDINWNQEARKIRKKLQAGKISMFEYAKLELDEKSYFGGDSLINNLSKLSDNHKLYNRIVVSYEEFYFDYCSWSKRISDFLPLKPNPYHIFISACPDYSKTISLQKDEFFADPLIYVMKYQLSNTNKHIRAATPNDHSHFMTKDEIQQIREIIISRCPAIAKYY